MNSRKLQLLDKVFQNYIANNFEGSEYKELSELFLEMKTIVAKLSKNT